MGNYVFRSYDVINLLSLADGLVWGKMLLTH